MTRLSLATLLMACAATACAGASPVAVEQAPVLAAYFDCVREGGGIAISAHRGQSGEDQPENSIQAFETTGRAIPGAILEMDAALTSDGVLVMMHDDSLDRTTTGHGLVANNTLAQVKAARLRAPNGTLTDAAPPTLEEALAAAGRVGAIASIDLKPSSEAATVALAQKVVDQVRRSGAAGRVILITYTPESARSVAALAPEMMISAGMDDVSGLEGLNAAQILAWTGAGEPKPALWRAVGARGVEAQFGTLGAPGRRLDDVYAADGDVSEYRALFDQSVTVIATDEPLAVKGVLGAELAAAGRCRR